MTIVVLTGAGLSAESGLGTFRDKDGLWTKYDLSEVATPEGFAVNPRKVYDFYNARRRNCREAEPNAAHFALAELEAGLGDDLVMVTQNVDDLLERAGVRSTIHMHGELMSALCQSCGGRTPWMGDLNGDERCPICGEADLRPDVVWFGEMPYHMDEIERALRIVDLFVAIGTSGEVYPAAGFVETARMMGADTLEINLERTGGSALFDQHRLGPASETVPAWVQDMLGQ